MSFKSGLRLVAVLATAFLAPPPATSIDDRRTRIAVRLANRVLRLASRRYRLLLRGLIAAGATAQMHDQEDE